MAALIGTAVLRKKDRSLLTASAPFVDDRHRPGTMYACFVRSEHAHATIRRIDASAALVLPAVIDVIDGDAPPASRKPIPMRICALEGMERFLHYPLARGTVRCSGEPVAVVVAETSYAAEDALAAEVVVLPVTPQRVTQLPRRAGDDAA